MRPACSAARFTIPEWGETFFVKSMSADYLCERTLRAKAEKHPTLYKILEPDEPVLPTAEPEEFYEQVEMRSGDAEAVAWVTMDKFPVGATVEAGGMTWVITSKSGLSATEDQLLRMPQDARTSTTIN